LLARAVLPIDAVVADAGGMGLKVFVDEEQAIYSVKSVLDKMATGNRLRGPVEFCISERETGREMVINTGREYPLTPQIKGAIKSLGGVVLVEDI
jgi:DNA polymerase-3 subunit alpha